MTHSINRLEAFSDGVIAIIITLLVFSLPVPAANEGNLLVNLLDKWEEFAAFFVSFFVIGVMWINHHNLFRIISKGDHILFLLNVFLLLGITIVPFTTRLMATHIRTDQNQVAAMIYAGCYLLTAFFFNILWRYASYKRRLIGVDVSHDDIQGITRSYNIGLLLYSVGFLLSFISAQVTLLINFGLAVFFALPVRDNAITRIDPS